MSLSNISNNSKAILYEATFPNGKLYIGISNNLKYRIWRHKHAVEHGSKILVHLAIRKYGIDNVRWRTLAIGLRSYIKDLEVAAIAKFKTLDRRFGYNITLGGESNPMDIPWVRERQSTLAAEAHARPATKIKHKAGMQNAAPKISKSMLIRATDPIWLHNVSEGTKKGLAAPDVRERCGDATRDTVWINNGKINRRININEAIPEEWILGRFSFPAFWITNGIRNKRVNNLSNLEAGWYRGMTYSSDDLYHRKTIK